MVKSKMKELVGHGKLVLMEERVTKFLSKYHAACFHSTKCKLNRFVPISNGFLHQHKVARGQLAFFIFDFNLINKFPFNIKTQISQNFCKIIIHVCRRKNFLESVRNN
jgi:hypothetical protein